jgi:hypothetical protein
MFESSFLTIVNLIYFNSYVTKANSILATELKQQLANDSEFLPTKEEKGKIKYVEEAFVDIHRKELDDIVMSHENISLSCGDASIDSATCQDSAAMIDYSIKSSNWLPPAKITEDVFYAIPTYVDKKCAIYLYPRKYRMSFLHDHNLQNFLSKYARRGRFIR